MQKQQVGNNIEVIMDRNEAGRALVLRVNALTDMWISLTASEARELAKLLTAGADYLDLDHGISKRCVHDLIIRPKAKRIECKKCGGKLPIPADDQFYSYLFSDLHICDKCGAYDKASRAHLEQFDTFTQIAYLWMCRDCGNMHVW